MKTPSLLCNLLTALCIGSFPWTSTWAAGDLSAGEPIRLKIRLGGDNGEHRFIPDALQFETGKLYALRIENPGGTNYYFGSQGLADAVFTRKAVVLDAAGKDLVQIYGPVRRFELKAGSAMEWWFIPIRTGVFEDLRSTKTHTDAGMRATIEVR